MGSDYRDLVLDVVFRQLEDLDRIARRCGEIAQRRFNGREDRIEVKDDRHCGAGGRRRAQYIRIWQERDFRVRLTWAPVVANPKLPDRLCAATCPKPEIRPAQAAFGRQL